MKRCFLLLLGCMMSLVLAAQELTIGSYNIRYRNRNDSVSGNGWVRRCPSICKQIRWERPDVFGAQEVLYPQLLDLEKGLGCYRWIGVGRDDGRQKGEYAAIFYNPERVELMEEGHFWLNETPDRPALGWDAACVRICTWGHFRDLQTKKDFYFLNLHMDHVGRKARSESARLVMERITQMTDGGRKLAVLTGDFNVSQKDELYKLFADSGVLKDCYVAAAMCWAENGTYNSFDGLRFTDERIDHIFVTPNTQVDAYAVRTDGRWQSNKDGKMERRNLSDHYPIFARVRFSSATPVRADIPETKQDVLTVNNRPKEAERLFRSEAVEKKIREVTRQLTNLRLAWMFVNCYPNTIDTTVHYDEKDADGLPDTFVYTGDIHAMWLRDSGAQVFPYVRLAPKDKHLQRMLAGVILRQLKCINIDPYANAFNKEPNPDGDWMKDMTKMIPELHERKWEIDSLCYVLRLAYEYWRVTGDASVFGDSWLQAVQHILTTFRDQQRRDGRGSYKFQRRTERQLDTMNNDGWGAPVKPVGLIASAFRPSDDATTLLFLVPSNFMAVTQLRHASEILMKVNKRADLAEQCKVLANEVSEALQKYAIYQHPKYGPIYAYEVDGFGNQLLMDDANVPSLLAMAYLGDVPINDPIYQNTRRFVWSEDNPYFFRGKAGEGIGGPHIGYDMPWPMSIMMRAFTSQDDAEIKQCVEMLMQTDAGTGFMHESFHKDDATRFTRKWFAWQNTLFGELIVKLIDDGKLELLNSISL